MEAKWKRGFNPIIEWINDLIENWGELPSNNTDASPQPTSSEEESYFSAKDSLTESSDEEEALSFVNESSSPSNPPSGNSGESSSQSTPDEDSECSSDSDWELPYPKEEIEGVPYKVRQANDQPIDRYIRFRNVIEHELKKCLEWKDEECEGRVNSPNRGSADD